MSVSALSSQLRCSARAHVQRAPCRASAAPRHPLRRPFTEAPLLAPRFQNSRRSGAALVVRANWGADVKFSSGRVVETGPAAEQLQRLLVDIGEDLVQGYSVPGQFVQAKTGDSEKAGFFAIASPPDANNAGVIELLIKAQGGTAEQIAAAARGSDLLVSSVMGKGFPIDRIPPTEVHTVLLFATGSGISPIKALIESGALQPSERSEVRLYYGASSPSFMAYRDSLAAWEEEHGVKVVPVFSQDGNGYVQDVFDKESGITDWSGVAAVLCGRKEMAQAVTELLASKGVPKERILLNF